MRCGSLFSGIAGVEFGLHRAGIEPAWFCEFDPQARSILQRHFPGVPIYEDVTTFEPGSVEPVDIITGGFPCQDISIAGGRLGLAGEKSGLWREFHRVLDSLRPEWCLIENVDSLLSVNGGRDLGTILGALGEMGYGWAFRVLDAQWAGVAQRRNRLFIVGHLGDRRAAEVLLEPEGGVGDSAPSREAWQEVAGAVGNGSADSRRGYRNDLDTNGAYVVMMRGREGKPGGGKGPLLSPDLSLTLATANDQVAFITENQRAEVRETPYSFALTTGGGKPGQGYAAIRQGMRVRRLTPLEWERLQGFPDNWTEGLSDSARYRCLGNAVPVVLSEWIGHRLMEVA